MTDGEGDDVYLVVKASVVIEIIKVRREGFSAPKVHIGNLEIVINCRDDQYASRKLIPREEG
jgi:hypothetical protein